MASPNTASQNIKRLANIQKPRRSKSSVFARAIGACMSSRGAFFVEDDGESEAKERIEKYVVDACLSNLNNRRL